MLEKIAGSQRTEGRFFDDGEQRSIYLGSLSVNDDPAKPYGSGPQSDQIGYAFATASMNGASSSRPPTTNRSSTSSNSNAEPAIPSLRRAAAGARQA
ncbi:hypothetical protein MES4922_300241 [Mesorhizobium ventifaucium]|uniref:Uncharacterized protein n=1 Tax=Mesorhizobium ventifaucium TaxID=666020 RepID=A0ABM9E251_9HYPH|nr:hypothetical protein MES4922_300241 [Mesorhizobium ventifaucium]